MASTKLMTTKDGRRFYKISVSRGHGLTPYTMRWYWPDGWSKRAADSELKRRITQFEADCKAGRVLTRAEQKEKAAQEAAEAAKLKTVLQYADGVFMPAKEVNGISENTRASYRMFLERHIFPVIGDVLLADVTPAMITKLLLDFRKSGKSHASTIKLYNILNGLFDMAFMDDSIPISPMLKVKRPVAGKEEAAQDDSMKALNGEEKERVLQCADQEEPKWRAFLWLAVDSGARRGELCGLQWKDINWEEGLITIKRNLQYTPSKGVYVVSTKTGKERQVDIGEDTAKVLKEWQIKQVDSLSEANAGKKTTRICKWVFNQDGTTEPIHPQSPTRYYKKFGEKYGFDHFHPHLLRHTSGTLSLLEGADIKSTAARLGHSEAVLLRKYAHTNLEGVKRAGQKAREAGKQTKAQGE